MMRGRIISRGILILSLFLLFRTLAKKHETLAKIEIT